MASSYYGNKGETVEQKQEELNAKGYNLKVDGIWGRKTEAAYTKDMQKSLNAKGASLKVDGIWGKNTQAAYDKYGTASSSSANAATSSSTSSTSSSSTNTSSTPSDAELRAQAEALYNPGYQQSLNYLTQQGDTLTTRYNRNVADFADVIEQALKDTELSIENSMIKRGMGRSSEANYQLSEKLAEVNKSAQEQLAEMEQDYSDNLAYLDTQRQTLQSTKEQNVQAKLLDLMQHYESVRQFNEELAFNEKQLAAASSSSGSGSSSTPAMTAEEIFGLGNAASASVSSWIGAKTGANSWAGAKTATNNKNYGYGVPNDPAYFDYSKKRSSSIYGPGVF